MTGFPNYQEITDLLFAASANGVKHLAIGDLKVEFFDHAQPSVDSTPCKVFVDGEEVQEELRSWGKVEDMAKSKPSSGTRDNSPLELNTEYDQWTQAQAPRQVLPEG